MTSEEYEKVIVLSKLLCPAYVEDKHSAYIYEMQILLFFILQLCI